MIYAIPEILYKAMAKSYPMGKVCQRRRFDGEIQYLVKTGSKAIWINSDQMDRPEDQREIEVFMV